MISLLGHKVGMTQIFTDQGEATPVTVVKVGPCFITQIKTEGIHGYNAVQVGYHQVSKRSLTKPEIGHLKNSSSPPLKFLEEFRVVNPEDFTLGQSLTVEDLTEGNLVNVRGNSIGKGFTGNQKRHHFTRGPMTHGSKNHRAPGSIGQGTSPGRVFPGKKMAGRMGGSKITVSKLKIMQIDASQDLVVLKGSVPGKAGTLLTIKNL